MKPRMTLDDISREINISRTTIYKVINNKGTVSEQTRIKILAALEKYNYTSNQNARNLALNRKYEIAFISFHSTSANYFDPLIKSGINMALHEYEDDGLIVKLYESDLNNPAQQLRHIDEAVRAGITSFVIAAANTAVLKDRLEKLLADGCSVILLSKDSPDFPQLPYVGVDYYKSGLLAAEVVGKMMNFPSHLQILVSDEHRTNIDIQNRLSGFLEGLKDYPKISLLPIKHGLATDQSVEKYLSYIFTQDTPLDGIFDITYKLETIGNVVSAYHKKDLCVVGFDLFTEIEPFIWDGTIDAIISQDISTQAYTCIKILIEEMCYNRVNDCLKQYSKLDIIMSHNLEYFLDTIYV